MINISALKEALSKDVTDMEGAGDQTKDILAKTLIDHACALNDEKKLTYKKRLTTIICTIGIASRDVSTIEKMIGAGMNIALINMAHGSYEHNFENFLNIRKAVEFYNKKHVIGYPLAIMIDLVGPEIRTGRLKKVNDASMLEVLMGDKITLTTDRAYVEKSTVDHLFVDYLDIVKVVKHGDWVSFDNGLITLNVVSVGVHSVNCVVECGGTLKSNMLLHLPGTVVDLPAFSEKDLKDIGFGLAHGVDMICASFIRSAVAVHELRELLGEQGKHVMVISKIENSQGMLNLNEIIKASDGIMVVRGKLAIEMSAENAFTAQTTIIARCNKAGKPVIVATQMLESTMTKTRPTRSEVTDVANAIISGAGCVMLTSETATGKYPVQSIFTMSNICREAEAAIWHTQLFSELVSTKMLPVVAIHAIAIAAVQTSYKCMATAIIVVATSGEAAHLVSKYRPRCPIISVTRNAAIARQNQLYRGVISIHFQEDLKTDWLKDVDYRIQFALILGQNRDFIKIGDPVVIIHGWKKGSGYINTMRVMYVAEPRDIILLPPTVAARLGSI